MTSTVLAILFAISPTQTSTSPMWPSALETRLRSYYTAQAKPPVFTPPAGSVAPDPLKLALVHLLQHDVHDQALREALLLDLVGVTPPPPPPDEPPPPSPLSIKSDPFDATQAIWGGSYGVSGGVAAVTCKAPSSGWAIQEIRQVCEDERTMTLTAMLAGTPPGAGQAAGITVNSAGGWLRVELTNGSFYALFAGGPTIAAHKVGLVEALRVRRVGTAWTVSYREAGTWVSEATVSKELVVSSVGLYAAARSGTPGCVAKFDSFEAMLP